MTEPSLAFRHHRATRWMGLASRRAPSAYSEITDSSCLFWSCCRCCHCWSRWRLRPPRSCCCRNFRSLSCLNSSCPDWSRCPRWASWRVHCSSNWSCGRCSWR